MQCDMWCNVRNVQCTMCKDAKVCNMSWIMHMQCLCTHLPVCACLMCVCVRVHVVWCGVVWCNCDMMSCGVVWCNECVMMRMSCECDVMWCDETWCVCPGHDVKLRPVWLVQVFVGLLAWATRRSPGAHRELPLKPKHFVLRPHLASAGTAM